MGFKLRKRQTWLFLPAAMVEVAVERILSIFDIHPLWQALILIVIALFLTILILKGKAIFHLRFYKNYYIDEVREIPLTKEQARIVFPEKEAEDKVFTIPYRIKKVKRRKKRFEL